LTELQELVGHQRAVGLNVPFGQLAENFVCGRFWIVLEDSFHEAGYIHIPSGNQPRRGANLFFWRGTHDVHRNVSPGLTVNGIYHSFVVQRLCRTRIGLARLEGYRPTGQQCGQNGRRQLMTTESWNHAGS
jgi:hypothetical protein